MTILRVSCQAAAVGGLRPGDDHVQSVRSPGLSLSRPLLPHLPPAPQDPHLRRLLPHRILLSLCRILDARATHEFFRMI